MTATAFQIRGYIPYLRRFVCILLFLLAQLVLPMRVSGGQNADFAWSDNGVAVTINNYRGTGGVVTVPSVLDGLPVTAIADFTFQSERAVTSVTIPGSVASVGSYAFLSCTALTNLVFEEGLKSLGDNLCRNCGELRSVSLPDSLLGIGSQAFIYCYKLSEINIPRGVTGIAGGVFNFCNGLMAINVDALNPTYSSVDGVLFNKDQSRIIKFPPGRGGQYSIPTNIISIDSTFAYCGQLTNITMPSSVVNIGNWAFDYCSGLKNVIIPNGVTNLGYAAFAHCGGLTNITIPNGVRNIGDWAFSECGNLYSITLPHAPRLGASVFSYCPKLRYLTFLGDPPTDHGLNLFQGDSSITVYYMPWATGWSTAFDIFPTMLWNPLVESSNANFGVRTNRFGFTISGTSDLVVIVEASTNLTNPVWSRLRTNTLTGGSAYFSDAGWTNYRSRYYRLRWP